MGSLTPGQKAFDITKYLDYYLEEGEPRDKQILDPDTGEVYAPGLKVKEDGTVERFDPPGS